MAGEETFSNVTPVQETFTNVTPIADTGPTGFWQNAYSAGKGLVNSLLSGNGPAVGAEAAGQGVSQAAQMAADDIDRQQQGRSTTYRAAAPIAQTLVPGLNPAAMENAAYKGDTAGVLGQAAVPATLAVTPVIGEAARKIPVPDVINVAAHIKANKAALMTAADIAQHPEQIPGRIFKKVVEQIPDPKPSPVPVVSKDPFVLTSPDTGTEPAIQTNLFPQPPDIKGGPSSFKKLTLSPGEDLGLGMGSEHTITNPQGQRIGSAQIEMKPDGVAHVHWLGGDFSDYGRKDVMGAIQEAYPNAEKITYDRRRLAKGDAAATTQPRQMNVAQAPSVNSVADQVVANTTGVKPLQSQVPLRDQGATTSRPTSDTPATTTPQGAETDPLKVKYPDPAQRQMVRANGERIVQAIGNDPNTMKAVHDLTRVDLRQAAINHGFDMGQTTVSNSKFAGEGSITREAMFNRLLDAGLKPSDIVRLAKQGQEQVSK